MFEFLSSANKSTIQSQIEYFERAIKESKSKDAYYPERQVFSDDFRSNDAIRRPSEESIGKAREWIGIQRSQYSDSKEILALCKRWEELFDAYQKKMQDERSAIQTQGAEARAQVMPTAGKTSPNGVKNFDGGEGRYGYRVDTGFAKKGNAAPVKNAQTVIGSSETGTQTAVAIPPKPEAPSIVPAAPAVVPVATPGSAPTTAAAPGSAPVPTPSTQPTAPAPAAPAAPKAPEAKDSEKIRREYAFSKGGKFHIVGKDGNAELVSVAAFPPELLQQLEKMDALGSKFADLFFLLSAYQAKYPESNFSARANEIQEKLAKSDPTNVAGLEQILEYYVANFTTDKPNLKRIKDVFAATSDGDRKARLFSFVRNELGQYDMVAAAIADRAMDAHDIGPEEMAAITALVKQYPESPELAAAEFKKSGSAFEKVKTNAGFGADQKAYLALFKKLSASYSDAKAHLRKTDAAIAENVRVALVKTGKSKDFAKEKAALEDRVLEQFLSASAAREILTASIAKKGPGTSTEYALYKDIEGIGALDWSDRTYDVGKEVGILVATEIVALGAGLVTAGAGAWAVNAAVYGTRGFKLAERYAMVGRMANATGKIATGSRWIAWTAFEGALFYEGTNTVRNMIEGRDWFEGAGDKKEILKSIVFVWALKGLSKLSAKVPGLAAKEGDDLSKFMVKWLGRVTLEGLGIGAASGAVDVYFGDGEWTRDQFIEGIIMALALRALGKAKDVYLKPRTGGGVSASEPMPTAPSSPAPASVAPASAPTASVRPARAEGRGTPERSTRAAEMAQIRKEIAAKRKEIKEAEDLIRLNEPGAAAYPQANTNLRTKIDGLNAEVSALRDRATALSGKGNNGAPVAPETLARPEVPRTERAGNRLLDLTRGLKDKIDLSWLKPVKTQEAVKKRLGEISHGFVDAAKAAPGGIWNFGKNFALGNTHGNVFNRILSTGKWPILPSGHGAAHAEHGSGVIGKIAVGGVVINNEIQKINDTPGGFAEWAEKWFTLHWATAEAIDIVATVALVRWVGWARAIAYESASEKFGDDDWSTNVGTLVADWAFGPVAAPVETDTE